MLRLLELLIKEIKSLDKVLDLAGGNLPSLEKLIVHVVFLDVILKSLLLFMLRKQLFEVILLAEAQSLH
jgi:hypothetical protein